jgi:hypothetical protein
VSWLDLPDLGHRLERELQEEFPSWDVGRERSGRWIARHPTLAVVDALTVEELREGMRARMRTQ